MLMARFTYRNSSLAVCEELSLNGTITFVAANSSDPRFPLSLRKHTMSNLPFSSGDRYLLNLTTEQVLNASSDLMGNALLANSSEPRLEDVWNAMPPLRHLGSWGGAGARVWTATRGSAVDLVLDELGECHLCGTPSPKQAAARLPGPLSSRFNVEGRVDALPVILLGFPVRHGDATRAVEADETGRLVAAIELAVAARRYDEAAAHAKRLERLKTSRLDPKGTHTSTRTRDHDIEEDVLSWEMGVVPVPEHTGRAQPVLIRFMRVSATGNGARRAKALYFDTMAYRPGACPHDGGLADCAPAAGWFTALLDNHFFWERTWTREGRMDLALPSRGGTDGALLLRQAQTALVLDMITRAEGVWPRYGTANGYEQPGIGANGFQDIFCASMMAALEWGLFEYAKAVLANWLTYYQREDGGVLCARVLECRSSLLHALPALCSR